MSSFNSISSLKAQRQLTKTTDALARSSERLSSGLRINRASDDAAGLAISSSLKADSKLYSTAARNVNDGISALNIMQGSLQSQNGILMRLKELAEQSANGVYSSAQRRGLNTEYQQLVKEFGRIGDTTTFNNLNLLLGGRGSNSSYLNVQAGTTGSSNSSLSIQLTDSGTLSGSIYAYDDPMADTPAIVVGVAYGTDDLASYGAAARIKFTDSGGNQRDALVLLTPNLGSSGVQFFIRGDQTNGSATTSADQWVYCGGSSLTYNTSTGKITGTSSFSQAMSGIAGGATGTASIDLSGVTFVNTPTSPATSCNNINFTGVESVAQARLALTAITQRLSDSSNELGKIGAIQSRLQISGNLISVMRENTISANSRIEDIDVAEESARYIAAQTQQQIAVSILAQTNNEPNFLLRLITGA